MKAIVLLLAILTLSLASAKAKQGLRGASHLSTGAIACQGPNVMCNGLCADLHSDILNCGGCGQHCGFNKSCCSGVCIDLMNDDENCGKCGFVCPAKGTERAVCSFAMCDYAS